MPLLLSCVLTALLALSACLFWRQRRRKARMLNLYRRLLRIRAEVPEGAEADLARLLANLQTIENEALDLLVNDRVAADAGMAIFLLLVQAVRGEIEAGNEEYETPE